MTAEQQEKLTKWISMQPYPTLDDWIRLPVDSIRELWLDRERLEQKLKELTEQNIRLRGLVIQLHNDPTEDKIQKETKIVNDELPDADSLAEEYENCLRACALSRLEAKRLRQENEKLRAKNESSPSKETAMILRTPRWLDTSRQLLATGIWNLSEAMGWNLGKFAPICFGWMIGGKGKRIR